MSENFGGGPLGPAAAIDRPDDPEDGYGQQTWFKPPSAPGAKNGTVIDPAWLNRIIAERIELSKRSGVSLGLNRRNDTFLADAVVGCLIRYLPEVLKTAGAPGIEHAMDTYYGDDSWRRLPTGVEMVVALDQALGSTSWRGTLSGDAIASLLDTYIGGTFWRSTSYVDGLLALKAPLASPALTGTPTAPTATLGTNTTQIATTAFVAAAVSALINAAPGALDTLNELAASLGNDANFASTVTNALALKAPLASPALTGTPTAPTATAGTTTTQIATTAFVQAAIAAANAFVVATQAEAEAGTDNAKGMTPLRAAQHLAANKAIKQVVIDKLGVQASTTASGNALLTGSEVTIVDQTSRLFVRVDASRRLTRNAEGASGDFLLQERVFSGGSYGSWTTVVTMVGSASFNASGATSMDVRDAPSCMYERASLTGISKAQYRIISGNMNGTSSETLYLYANSTIRVDEVKI